MLHALGNLNDYARLQLDGGFAPFLVPATAIDAHQHLHLLVVDVPVVAASRLEGYVDHVAVVRRKVAVADEVLRVGGIRLAPPPIRLQVNVVLDVYVTGKMIVNRIADAQLLNGHGDTVRLHFAHTLLQHLRDGEQLGVGQTHVPCAAHVGD